MSGAVANLKLCFPHVEVFLLDLCVSACSATWYEAHCFADAVCGSCRMVCVAFSLHVFAGSFPAPNLVVLAVQ